MHLVAGRCCPVNLAAVCRLPSGRMAAQGWVVVLITCMNCRFTVVLLLLSAPCQLLLWGGQEAHT